MSNLFTAARLPFTIAVGTGVGGAVGGAIAPAIQTLANDAWTAHPDKPLAASIAATLAAELYGGGHADSGEAIQTGYDSGRFNALVEYARTAPDLAVLHTLRNRRLISPDNFLHGLHKAKVSPEYESGLTALLDQLLSPEVLALAIVRGLIDDQNILPVAPPTTAGKVKAFPRFPIDAVTEARGYGFDKDHLSVLVGIAGRPMGPEAAALATFKKIIDPADYERAIAEGDVRNEWAEAIYENSRFVVSPQDAAGLRLRGWKTRDEAAALGALHGATQDTMDLLYLNRGRPATVHQVHIGYARGGAVQGAADEREAVHQSVVRSDIRPEFEGVLWAGRYTYPSAFVIRALTQDGTFSRDVAHQTLIEMGWKPELATLAADAWSGGAASAAAQPWLNRARGRLFTTAHAEYLDGEIPDTAAVAVLERIGATAAEANAVVDLWTEERGIFRKDLTQAQVLKFYKRGDWTRQQAFDWLIQHAVSEADADALLDFG